MRRKRYTVASLQFIWTLTPRRLLGRSVVTMYWVLKGPSNLVLGNYIGERQAEVGQFPYGQRYASLVRSLIPPKCGSAAIRVYSGPEKKAIVAPEIFVEK